MERRVVRTQFDAIREANGVTTRQFRGGAVLNLLQWTRPDQARFTVEGEGAEIWFCPQSLLDKHTMRSEAAAG
jgi:hypothetical protein